MSDNFEYAIPFILEHEGGWCDVKGDSGGETFAGISRNNFPNWIGWRQIDAMKAQPNFPRNLTTCNGLIDLVYAFYQANFWQSSWDNLDKRVAAKVMDIGANCGISWGGKILQTACGALPLDGVIGTHTLALANAMDVTTLLQDMVVALEAHYDKIIETHPDYKKFETGWDARASWIPS